MKIKTNLCCGTDCASAFDECVAHNSMWSCVEQARICIAGGGE